MHKNYTKQKSENLSLFKKFKTKMKKIINKQNCI